jgi:meiotic recombination protein DMC1
MELINECSMRFAEDKDFRLLVGFTIYLGPDPKSSQIVDSIMALFRVDYSGRGELSERQQKVGICQSTVTLIHQKKINSLHRYFLPPLDKEPDKLPDRCYRSWPNFLRSIMFRRPHYLIVDTALTFPFSSSLDFDPTYKSGAMCIPSFIVSLSLSWLTLCLADPGATMTFVAGGALKPIGGHILSHASATRLFLRKGNKNCTTWESCQADDSSSKQILGRAEERVAKLVDSPDRPESEASYKLDEGGWADV